MFNKLRSAAKILVSALVLVSSVNAATITDAALAAWNESVQQSRDNLARQSPGPAQFLTVNRKRGKPEHLLSSDGSSIGSPNSKGLSVPGGLIHHWIGTVFIRDANVFDVVSTLQKYDNYSKLFRPALIDSRLLAHSQDSFQYQLRFVQKEFGISTAILGDFQSTYSQTTPRSGYSITEATELREIRNAGTPQERVVPFAASHGYIEKSFTVVRYRESDGGTYVQVETLVLSRDIPGPLRWMANPLVKRFAQQTMAATLDRLRTGVTETHSMNSVAMR